MALRGPDMENWAKGKGRTSVGDWVMARICGGSSTIAG
jgi:hypothetical protein